MIVLRTDRPNIAPVNDPIGAVVWGMDTSNVELVSSSAARRWCSTASSSPTGPGRSGLAEAAHARPRPRRGRATA